MKKIAVLISNKGSGSNLQAIVDNCKIGKINGKIVVVVSDKTDAYGLVRAKKNKIPQIVKPFTRFKNKKSRKLYGEKLGRELKEKYKVDLVVLAGWMIILPPSFIKYFSYKIINLHPGLIPDKKGGRLVLSDGSEARSFEGEMADEAIEATFKSGITISGSTTHFVTREIDWGPVIMRAEEKIKRNDSIDSYYSRLKKKEHIILPLSIKLFCENKLKVNKNNLVKILDKRYKKHRKVSPSKDLKILIIGSGGREHALAWKIARSRNVSQIFIAPGNTGTASLGKNIDIKANDLKALVSFAKEKQIDLTIVGPEAPLALGIVDLFEKNNLAIFGPTKKAARLESSKVFAKRFMKKFKIPTASFKVFSDYKKAKKHLKNLKFPQVVKADGLAAGKGVFVCKTLKEGLKALKTIMVEKKFGPAGNRLVIEECLIGQEASMICLTDGKKVLPFLSAQDHKPIFDGDKGPNTGGIGVYAPTPIVDKKILKQTVKKVLKPTILGMKKIGCSYRGALYAGLMLTNKGIKVLEFNCRFGDPETQPQLMLLKSDLVNLMITCTKGNLKTKKVSWYPGSSVCVVLASKGYPGKYKKGFEIKNLPKKDSQDLQVFHAGTKAEGDKIVTNSGRVLGVTSRGKTLKQAIKKAYLQAKKIKFKNKYYRTDIGVKGLSPSSDLPAGRQGWDAVK